MEFKEYVASLSDSTLGQMTLECALSASHGPEPLIRAARERLEILQAELARRNGASHSTRTHDPGTDRPGARTNRAAP